MQCNGAFKHLFEVVPHLIRVEVVDDGLQLIRKILIDHLLVLILAHCDFVHAICLLVLNKDVPFCQLWLIVKNDEGSLNGLLEANICRLEGLLGVFSGLGKICDCCLSLASVDLGARLFHHVVELLDSHELSSLFI